MKLIVLLVPVLEIVPSSSNCMHLVKIILHLYITLPLFSNNFYLLRIMAATTCHEMLISFEVGCFFFLFSFGVGKAYEHMN